MENTPYNEFIEGILALYRKVLSGRTRMGVRVRLQNGFYKGSHAPYGYDYNPDIRALEINERESRAVVGMFHAYLEYECLGAVVRWLKKEKIPTKRGGIWKTNTVRGILSNKVYLGYYIYEDIVTYHEEIRLIPDETFLKVQKKLKERANCGPAGHYDKRIERFRGQVFWGNDTDNEVIQDYLARQADMPQCSRCGENIAVRKWVFEDSPIYGRLQRYHCNKCRYRFQRSPRKFDKIRPKCPSCGCEKVYSEGKKRFGGKEYQYWECLECGGCWGIEILM